MHPPIEDRFYDLLGRKLAGECSASELEELESVLQQHPELQLFYDQLLTHSSEISAMDIENAYAIHRVKMMGAVRGQHKTFFSITRPLVWALAAAAVIVVVSVTW